MALYKISDVKNRITVGAFVKTNGDGMGIKRTEKFLRGQVIEVGTLDGTPCFYLGHNLRNGAGHVGAVSPESMGFAHSWVVYLDNSKASIRFLTALDGVDVDGAQPSVNEEVSPNERG